MAYAGGGGMEGIEDGIGVQGLTPCLCSVLALLAA